MKGLERHTKKNVKSMTNNNKIGLAEVKQALKDSRFRAMLPADLKGISTYLNNPGCPCNLDLFRDVLKNHREALSRYYPSRKVEDLSSKEIKIAQNYWSVINCSTEDLEDNLKKLPAGRKQLAITRYEDQVTVIINELDIF
jgi:hypothetical protein